MLNLHSQTRQRLLRYYFTNPTARVHLRDLAQRLGVDPSNLSKELRNLESEGLFTSETSGRQKYFRLNRKYPLFTEVRRIVVKTIGIAPLLSEALQRIGGIEEAYLYGSFARNQQDVASDIDVIVIGNPQATILAETIRALERQLGREINYTVLTRKEFNARRARQDAFLEDIWHNGRPVLVAPKIDSGASTRYNAGSGMGLASRGVNMIRTYKAILHGDHVEWLDQRPEQTQPVPVHITPLEDTPPKSAGERGRLMAEALAALASRGTFAAIADPVAWQRELRHERALPTRDR